MFISELSEKEKTNAECIGFDDMVQQTIEECSELIKALCKYNRSRGIGQKTETTKNEASLKVIEEMADVEICCEQLSYLFDKYEIKDFRDKVNNCKKIAFDKVHNRYSEEKEFYKFLDELNSNKEERK